MGGDGRGWQGVAGGGRGWEEVGRGGKGWEGVGGDRMWRTQGLKQQV